MVRRRLRCSVGAGEVGSLRRQVIGPDDVLRAKYSMVWEERKGEETRAVTLTEEGTHENSTASQRRKYARGPVLPLPANPQLGRGTPSREGNSRP